MCNPISWIEYDGNVYFLTAKDLRTKKGKELKKYLGDQYENDVVGHGAIDYFFELKGNGIHKEVNEFNKPSLFPEQIIKAVKNGDFRGMFICEDVLTKKAWAEYEKIEAPARAEFGKIEAPARAEFEKIESAAWAEYYKIKDAARAEFGKIENPAWAEFEKIKQNAFWDLVVNPENRKKEWR
jgi:hypothetical protein